MHITAGAYKELAPNSDGGSKCCGELCVLASSQPLRHTFAKITSWTSSQIA